MVRAEDSLPAAEPARPAPALDGFLGRLHQDPRFLARKETGLAKADPTFV